MLPSEALATHSFLGYHWARTANPFTLKLVSRLTSEWTPYLEKASHDWAKSSVLNTKIIQGSAKPAARKACKPVVGRVVVCNAAYGRAGWSGLVNFGMVPYSTHISWARARANDSSFDVSLEFSFLKERKQHLMCQEIGHTLGLDHQDEINNNPNTGSCMDYTNDLIGPPDSLSPNKHDYRQMKKIYKHFDDDTNLTKTSVSELPVWLESIDFDQPNEWGRLIQSDNDGRTDVYERDFGNGYKVFSVVILAK